MTEACRTAQTNYNSLQAQYNNATDVATRTALLAQMNALSPTIQACNGSAATMVGNPNVVGGTTATPKSDTFSVALHPNPLVGGMVMTHFPSGNQTHIISYNGTAYQVPITGCNGTTGYDANGCSCDGTGRTANGTGMGFNGQPCAVAMTQPTINNQQVNFHNTPANNAPLAPSRGVGTGLVPSRSTPRG